ncbi:MAG: hypothetical protein IKE01_04525 [Clostridia bacterium]|nr:hypothetical protein [Clostridia bacterium]
MTDERNRALEEIKNFQERYEGKVEYDVGGSKDISPLVEHFFDTCIRVISCVNENDWNVIRNVKAIAEAGLYLSLNTFQNQSIAADEYACINEMYKELEKLLDDSLANARPLTVKIGKGGKLEHVRTDSENLTDWEDKIYCISMVLFHNQEEARSYPVSNRPDFKYMVFQSYNSLKCVISKLNTEWNALVRRGFSLEMYDAYRQSVMYEVKHGNNLSGARRYVGFMELLSGESKLIPVYKYVCVGYTLVSDTDSDIARIEPNKSEKVFRME